VLFLSPPALLVKERERKGAITLVVLLPLVFPLVHSAGAASSVNPTRLDLVPDYDGLCPLSAPSACSAVRILILSIPAASPGRASGVSGRAENPPGGLSKDDESLGESDVGARETLDAYYADVIRPRSILPQTPPVSGSSTCDPAGDFPGSWSNGNPTSASASRLPVRTTTGTKPDEVYANARAACDRVSQLILSGGQTEPPGAVRLAELRHLRKLSQAQVAERAGIKQSAMARIEGRGDILLSTLRRVVSAMRGHLSIRVEFPDGTGRELSGLLLGLPAGPDVFSGAASRPGSSPGEASPSPGAAVRTRRGKEGSAQRTGLRAVETTVESGARSSPTETVKPGPGKSPAKRGRRATGKSETPGK
jgi:hypothetical protein